MPAETTSRAKTDAASKLLFTGAVVADLLRIRLPALAAALDLDAIRPLPTEYIGLDRSRRIGDAAFLVPRKDGNGVVLVSAEFQAANDRRMLKRTRKYTRMLVADARRHKIIGRDDHPLTLTFVIHTGGDEWTAADGTEAFEGLALAAALDVVPYARAAYILEDIGARGKPLPEGAKDNRYLAAARLVRCVTPDLVRQLEREWRRFPGVGHEPFRRGMLAWAEEEVRRSPEAGLRVPTFEELEGSEGTKVGGWFKDNLERERAEALAAERVQILRRQAERKFGPNVAGRLSRLLESADDDSQRTALDWIIDCATGEDLLERLSGAASPH